VSFPTKDYSPRINASGFCVQWSRLRRVAARKIHSVSLSAPARIGEMPDEAAACPFPIQYAKRLMQKIHRLTDN
jgi:hypothetical protein